MTTIVRVLLVVTLFAFSILSSPYGAFSATFPLVVDAGWTGTEVQPPRFFFGAEGTFSTDVFTFSSASPTILRITDDFCKGDRFRIFDNGVPIGDTSVVPIGSVDDCAGFGGPSGDPVAAFASTVYSHGSFPLGPGNHSITILAIVSPFGGGRGFIKVDSVPAPVAANDSYSTNEDTALLIAPSGVLGNDTGSGLTAVLVADAQYGSVTLNANGSFTYVPDANFNGVDSFMYLARTESTDSNVATVTITVNPVNDPPFFNVIADQFIVTNAGPQGVAVVGISPGPPDEVLQTVTLTASSNNTAVVPNPIGVSLDEGGSSATLTYQPAANANGTATVTVTAQDNGGTAGCSASTPPCDTFVRTFQITVAPGASTAVTASVTQFNSTGATTPPTLAVTVTFRPIDFTGDGVPDCYFVFPPTPYNVIPTNADHTPEAAPSSIPGDLAQVCGATLQFSTAVPLHQWITDPATNTTDLTYVSLVRNPQPAPGAAPIWTGIVPVGSVNFTTGDQVADQNTVTLHTVFISGKSSIDKRLSGIVARVYNRNDSAFKSAYGGKNPPGSKYPDIYKANIGFLATCTTNESGVCLATEPSVGDYLVIIKFSDCRPGDENQGVVYDGLPKAPSDFTNGVATKSFTIVKKLSDTGSFLGYQTGTKTTFVPGCGP